MARSGNWRIRKSTIPAIEGANVLRVLGRFGGIVGVNRPISFNTEVSYLDTEKKDIHIQGLFNTYPVDGEDMDVMVGFMLHEAMHLVRESDKVYERFRDVQSIKPGSPFWYFLNIGEDIHVDLEIRQSLPNLNEYVQKARDWAAKRKRAYRKDNLLETWCELELYGNKQALMDAPDEMLEPLQNLVELSNKIKLDGWGGRVGDYWNTWVLITDFVENQHKEIQKDQKAQQNHPKQQKKDMPDKKDSKPEPPSSKSESEPQPQKDMESGEPKPEPELEPDYMPTPNANVTNTIDPELEKLIQDALEKETEDLTEEIGELLVESGTQLGNFTIIQTVNKDGALLSPNNELVGKLKVVLSIKKRLQKRDLRGEVNGKIDTRKLHRAVMDGKCFKQRFKFPGSFPESAILLDLSGSMTTEQRQEVIMASCAMTALVKSKVYGYQERNRQVMVTRLDEGYKVRVETAGGNTPSGLALITTAKQLKRGGLVIHLTDGKHNKGISPYHTRPVIDKMGIDVVNVIWGDNATPDAYDGMIIKSIKGLAEFPSALQELLVEKLGIRF